VSRLLREPLVLAWQRCEELFWADNRSGYTSASLLPGKGPPMTASKDAIVSSLIKSFDAAKQFETPYRHWLIENCLPQQVVDEILGLPFPAPALDGVSGKREVHNATRKYFDAENMERHAVCRNVNAALQDARVTAAIDRVFGTKLKGTFLRVEFAQDINGFWLEPHTDLGVKSFTFLLYMSKDAQHRGLGTDIYDRDKKHVGASPFVSNGAMIFVPSDITYHGFEAREIAGVRKSVIINYVTNDWRAREQLAYPDQPIG
jgi:hypothetical protein